MTQYSGQGMMNRTDFSVRRKTPVSASMASLGTTMWMPLEARTFRPPASVARSWTSSVHTPAALMVRLARISWSVPVARSVTRAPWTWPRSSVRKPVTFVRLAASAPRPTAVRTRSMTRRASSTRASKKRMEPARPLVSREGARAEVPLRPRWRWIGTVLRPREPARARASYMPTPTAE